jgi:predicted signal transduction protein with EAL and GGDEF domain
MGFLDRFDKTLYQAKSDGRNKSVIFTSTTETIARYTFNNNNLPNKKSSVVLSKTQFQTST